MKTFKISTVFLIITAIIVSTVYYGKIWVDNSPLFLLRNIRISGNEFITDNSILSLTEIKPETHIFKIETRKIENKILSNKLVKNVSVKRIYPSTISIKIKEINPLAFVISKNCYILDENAELLPMPEQIRVYDLPLITGIKKIEADLEKNSPVEKIKTAARILNIIKNSKINLYNNISEINFTDKDLIVFYLYDSAIPVYLNKTELYEKLYSFSQFLEYANSNNLMKNLKYVNLCYKDQIIIKEK